MAAGGDLWWDVTLRISVRACDPDEARIIVERMVGNEPDVSWQPVPPHKRIMLDDSPWRWDEEEGEMVQPPEERGTDIIRTTGLDIVGLCTRTGSSILDDLIGGHPIMISVDDIRGPNGYPVLSFTGPRSSIRELLLRYAGGDEQEAEHLLSLSNKPK